MKYYTDYPITELGDIPEQRAPVRICHVLDLEVNELYVRVLVEGIVKTFKRGYLYAEEGRCGKVPPVYLDDLLAAVKKREEGMTRHSRRRSRTTAGEVTCCLLTSEQIVENKETVALSARYVTCKGCLDFMEYDQTSDISIRLFRNKHSADSLED